jgi:hypothetical protein
MITEQPPQKSEHPLNVRLTAEHPQEDEGHFSNGEERIPTGGSVFAVRSPRQPLHRRREVDTTAAPDQPSLQSIE